MIGTSKVFVTVSSVSPARPTRMNSWYTDSLAAPPFSCVAVPTSHSARVGFVQHRAESTPELGVDELPGSLPAKVLVV